MRDLMIEATATRALSPDDDWLSTMAALLRAVEPAPGVPPVTYNSNVPAPLWLPPLPSPWSTPVVAVSAGTVVAVPTAPVVTYRPLLPVIPMPGQYYPGRKIRISYLTGEKSIKSVDTAKKKQPRTAFHGAHGVKLQSLQTMTRRKRPDPEGLILITGNGNL